VTKRLPGQSNHHRDQRRPGRTTALIAVPATVAAALIGCSPSSSGDGGGAEEPASMLLDLSGLAWLGGDEFVAVHDSKNSDELDRPRVSILRFTGGTEGTVFRSVDLRWPDPLGASNDLESVAGIPGSDDLLFAESADDGDLDFRRIFLARWDGETLSVVDYAPWPVDVFNVEGIAVADVGDGYVFVFAERAQEEPSTQIQWATFDPQTLDFGSFSSVTFDNPDSGRLNRPVVGIDIDSRGEVYIVSAFDPDVDDGPFRSSVYQVGGLVDDGNGPQLVLKDEPSLVAQVDGFKVESVAVREADGSRQVFIGTDDENLGNVLRPLP
jgi:hypothetical protein